MNDSTASVGLQNIDEVESEDKHCELLEGDDEREWQRAVAHQMFHDMAIRWGVGISHVCILSTKRQLQLTLAQINCPRRIILLYQVGRCSGNKT